ncbi:hypothetical protein D9M68_399970 [compost metagenome]
MERTGYLEGRAQLYGTVAGSFDPVDGQRGFLKRNAGGACVDIALEGELLDAVAAALADPGKKRAQIRGRELHLAGIAARERRLAVKGECRFWHAQIELQGQLTRDRAREQFADRQSQIDIGCFPAPDQVAG